MERIELAISPVLLDSRLSDLISEMLNHPAVALKKKISPEFMSLLTSYLTISANKCRDDLPDDIANVDMTSANIIGPTAATLPDTVAMDDLIAPVKRKHSDCEDVAELDDMFIMYEQPENITNKPQSEPSKPKNGPPSKKATSESKDEAHNKFVKPNDAIRKRLNSGIYNIIARYPTATNSYSSKQIAAINKEIKSPSTNIQLDAFIELYKYYHELDWIPRAAEHPDISKIVDVQPLNHFTFLRPHVRTIIKNALNLHYIAHNAREKCQFGNLCGLLITSKILPDQIKRGIKMHHEWNFEISPFDLNNTSYKIVEHNLKHLILIHTRGIAALSDFYLTRGIKPIYFESFSLSPKSVISYCGNHNIQYNYDKYKKTREEIISSMDIVAMLEKYPQFYYL